MQRHDWDAEAKNWIAWVRAQPDDAFHTYAPRFFDRFVPASWNRALDLGCGEGRSTRRLVKSRADDPSPAIPPARRVVVGVDSSAAMLDAASEAGVAPPYTSPSYAQADAEHLPFADRSFDLVVAYNVLMDLDDLDRSLREIGRVLTEGGALAACVLHPLAEAGAFETREADAPFVIGGSYFDERTYRATFRRRGLQITFSSRRRTLQSYVSSLRAAGLMVAAIEEPVPDAATMARDPSEARWARVPLFLFVLAVKTTMPTATP